MVRVIAVRPVDGGWTVHCDSFGNGMMFRSGAKAEAAARRLGERLARAGQRVEIRLFLRDGTQAARFICAPEATPELVWETPPREAVRPCEALEPA